MTTRFTHQSALCMFAAMATCAVPAAGAPVRVLILTGQTVHDWKATTPLLEQMYKDAGPFQLVPTIEDVSKIEANTFADCDVIVSNWTCHPQMTGGPWTPEGKRAFGEALRSGKGMVSIHAASTACHDWSDFQEISGLTWKLEHTSHTTYHTFKVVIRDRSHPITQNMPDFWTTDELYQRMVRLAGTDAHLLADAWAEGQFKGVSSHEPMLITTRLGAGRGVNLLLGHDVRAMRNPAFRTLLLRSTEWAATGRVTTPIPEDWPGCAAAAAIVGVDEEAAIRAATRYAHGASREAATTVEQLVTAAVSRTGEKSDANRSRLAARLGGALSDCTTPEAKSFFCRQLANIGTPAQVPAIAALLLDEQVSTMARLALERIPGPAAAKALRDALPTARGAPRVGIVNSLGNKADVQAIPSLEPLLKDSDAALSEAVRAALSRIRTRAPAAYRWELTPDSMALLNHDWPVWRFNYPRKAVPYFHPVNLPDGTELTWLNPPDHAHHHALWFAWKMLNGVNYWEHTPDAGVTEVVRVDFTRRPDFSSRIELEVSYHPADKPPVLTEKRSIEISVPDPDGVYRMDWLSAFKAGDTDLELKGGTAGGGYAGLSVRISRDSRDWLLLDSEGRRVDRTPSSGFPEGLHGQRARWADFSFVSTATGMPAGITLMDHPANLRYPSYWHDCMFADAHFGYFSPAPLWKEPYVLPAGQALTLRYRVLVHPGRPDVTRLEQEFRTSAEGQ